MHTSARAFLAAAGTGLLAALPLACGDGADPAAVSSPIARASAATRTPVAFVVGPLTLTGIDRRFPDGRIHFVATLTGPVTGDFSGTADLVLDAKVDGPGGSGPVSGGMALATGAAGWQGNLTGVFVGAAPAPGSQLLSKVVLHGPGEAQLTAECDETSATSETLVCTGEILRPHG